MINEKYTTIKLWEQKEHKDTFDHVYDYNPHIPTNLNRLYVVFRGFVGFQESTENDSTTDFPINFPINIPVICSLVCLGKRGNEYFWRFQVPSHETGDYATRLTPIANGDKWIGLPIEW
jgi:hypothetical protein